MTSLPISMPIFSGDAYVMRRVGDEIGFDAQDTAALYGVSIDELPNYLRSLGATPIAVFQRIVADADALRVGYRHLRSSDTLIAALQAAFTDFPFTGLIMDTLGAGGTGWRLDTEQALALAAHTAAIIHLHHSLPTEASDELSTKLSTELSAAEVQVLARRLARMTAWNRAEAPLFDVEFRDRVVDMITFLIEFSEIL